MSRRAQPRVILGGFMSFAAGSPHHNQGGLTRGGVMSRWVERHYPGAFFVPRVEYVSVAGQAIRSDPSGTGLERWIYRNHKQMCGRGDTWGDGIVPVESALLRGSRPIVLEGVSHFGRQGGRWYGDGDVIPAWLEPALAGQAGQARTGTGG